MPFARIPHAPVAVSAMRSPVFLARLLFIA
jgi:hypothetical protein